MTLITNEVFDYMLDDVQRSTMRSVSKMNDVVEHLKLRHGLLQDAEKYSAKAAEVQSLLKQAATAIDELPALGADLEALAGIKQPKDKKPVFIYLSEEEAIPAVGPKMTIGAMERALAEHYNGSGVSFDMMNKVFTVTTEEETE